MTAILALIMTNLPTIIKAGQAGWALISRIRETARQQGAWTPEFEAQYQAQLNAANDAPESLTDAERGVVAKPVAPVEETTPPAA